MEATIEEQAVDTLLRLMEFYHDKLLKAEKQAFTGIQAAQFRLLFLLTSVPMISMSALGNMLYISKPYMTTLIDSLIAEELVERHPDNHDRRVINISITEKGLERLNVVKSAIQKQLRSVLSDLEESDLKDLCSTGERLVSIVSKIQ
ncbi:MarR family winged helix-turn-helix transcriptional regulator [Methanospirillum stamsii]|uniref:HTH marR-type domain-containing protein n=1 Tax=Methanospirillum stamsii TaxID=1277351 RepID=A0A2V2N9R7_9EURY|nr:MarR family winged helix-turn-helix transcriptional regulator [Methanospirillum stamsii]PWR75480.1 hypothetical protein DLD82_04960 [Methanospirillum stamsii]